MQNRWMKVAIWIERGPLASSAPVADSQTKKSRKRDKAVDTLVSVAAAMHVLVHCRRMRVAPRTLSQETAYDGRPVSKLGPLRQVKVMAKGEEGGGGE